MHRSAPEKPVQLCIRVPDVDAWHRYATAQGVAGLSKLFVNEALGIRAFVFEDPEGYQIEVQTATRAVRESRPNRERRPLRTAPQPVSSPNLYRRSDAGNGRNPWTA
jgi:hypothetical protein